MAVGEQWLMPMMVGEQELPVVGSSYLDGRPSTIFELTERGTRLEIEVVNDSPTLHRLSSYSDSERAAGRC